MHSNKHLSWFSRCVFLLCSCTQLLQWRTKGWDAMLQSSFVVSPSSFCLFVSITGNAVASINFSFTDFAMMGIQGRNYREHTMFPKISLSVWQLFQKMFLMGCHAAIFFYGLIIILELFSLLFVKHMLSSHVRKPAFVRSLSPQRWLSSPRWEGCSTQGSDWPTSPWVTASTWIPTQREECQIICWPHFMTPFKHD